VAGLTRIGMHVPSGRESVAGVLAAMGRPQAEITRYDRLYGLERVAVAEEGGVEQLLQAALADLVRSERLDDVGLVLYAHMLLAQVPPGHDLLGRVLEPFGLEDRPSFGIAHVNCSALFRAIELAQIYVERFPSREVLVLAGDHVSFMAQARLVPGVSAMGDAAVCFLVRDDAARYRCLARAWRQQTAFHRGMHMDAGEAKGFNRVYIDLLAGVVGDCVAAAGLTLDDVDLILPHNVNAITWSRFVRCTGYPKERIFLDLLPELGHTMTTDALLNLGTAARLGRIRAGDRCLLVGVGAGSYFAASLVEAQPNEETA
jgi:3-oxoacyl-[acyl-carrier-protein] synthase-3